jgi:hypothetical protein
LEKQNPKPGKDFSQCRAKNEPVDSIRRQLRQKKVAALMAPRPIHSRSFVRNEMAMVRRITFHHLHQRFAHFGIVVHDQQLHYCGGAV